MDTKHTSGPWELSIGTGGHGSEFVIYNDVTICKGDDEAVAWEANARLIAAAPELLEALEAYISSNLLSIDHERNRERDALALRTKAIAAIDKARGE